MMKLLLPILLLIFGVAGGVGAGILLAPDAESEASEPATETEEAQDAPAEDNASPDTPDDPEKMEADDSTSGAVEFLNMSNQFIIPLVDDGAVNGIVVTTISLEVVEGSIAAVNLLEPKLRDQFLQVLFNHANNGGFDGNFTDFRYIQSLKDELLRNAQVVAGKDVTDVLILDLVRQDP